MYEHDALNESSVLVVEDHSFSRITLVTLLQRLGITSVHAAKDGVEAEEILNRSQVNAVITDINMPNMNGIELLKKIRLGETANRKDIRVIAVTSYTNVEVIRACMTLDINAFLVKPITIDNVKNKLLLALDETAELFHEAEYAHVAYDFDCISDSPRVRISERQKPDRTLNKKINWPHKNKNKPEQVVKPKTVISEPVPGKTITYMTVSTISSLESGMVLVQDLCAKNGVCLIAAGVVLNKRLLNRLNELSSIIELDQLKVKTLVDRRVGA